MGKAAFTLLLVAAGGLFVWLGVWQVQRLEWKTRLIAATEHNLSLPATTAPPPQEWTTLNQDAVYRKVSVSGTYLPVSPTFVLASTVLGRGYWAMSPLQSRKGFTVFINRGFVTGAERQSVGLPQGEVHITGLLRLSEPHGSLLQANRPVEEAWYSRDITAMAAVRGLDGAAPYFIDADAASPSPPVGGLTVVGFRNNHLQYALTWFGLALLCGAGLGIVWRPRRF